jgi:hypothetical protein
MIAVLINLKALLPWRAQELMIVEVLFATATTIGASSCLRHMSVNDHSFEDLLSGIVRHANV